MLTQYDTLSSVILPVSNEHDLRIFHYCGRRRNLYVHLHARGQFWILKHATLISAYTFYVGV